MIESALATVPTAAPRADAGYQSWQSAVHKAVMRHDLNDRTAGPMPTFGNMVHTTALAAQGMQYAPAGNSVAGETGSPDIAYAGEKDDGFGFGDVLDIINPLQHLPVIGTLYRKFTGDTLKPFSNIIGGAIFGGPIGAVSSTMNVIVKNRTGKDIAENAFAAIGFDVTPRGSVKPEIIIEETAITQNFAGPSKSLAAANLYERTAHGHKNFAGKAANYSWNT